jgi:hypothetical protein
VHVPSSVCEWCHSSGLVRAFHRQYAGSQTVYVERADRDGEVHTRRMPGSIAAHCSCSLGAWMRERLEIELQRRIPTLSDVINGRVPYVLERPDTDDEQALTPAASTFLREWKKWFGFPRPPRGVENDPIEMSNQLRARAERIEAERTEEVEIA